MNMKQLKNLQLFSIASNTKYKGLVTAQTWSFLNQRHFSSSVKSVAQENNYKFLLANQTHLSKKYYQDIIAGDLILKQNYTTIMQLPCIEKIVLNTSSKIYTNDKKYILFTLAALELLSGQKPQLTYARKSVANFKIREQQILGCKVILRENQMYAFLEKLSKIIFPRIRDYSKKNKMTQTNQTSLITTSSCKPKTSTIDKFSSFNLGFQNMMIFPELENHYELVDTFRGMNLTFVLSNSNQKTCSLILSGFQLPVFA